MTLVIRLFRIVTQTNLKKQYYLLLVLKGFLDTSKGAKEMLVFLDSAGKGPTQDLSRPQIELGWFEQLDTDWSILTEMIPGTRTWIVQLTELMELWSLAKFHNTLPGLNNSSQLSSFVMWSHAWSASWDTGIRPMTCYLQHSQLGKPELLNHYYCKAKSGNHHQKSWSFSTLNSTIFNSIYFFYSVFSTVLHL